MADEHHTEEATKEGILSRFSDVEVRLDAILEEWGILSPNMLGEHPQELREWVIQEYYDRNNEGRLLIKQGSSVLRPLHDSVPDAATAPAKSAPSDEKEHAPIPDGDAEPLEAPSSGEQNRTTQPMRPRRAPRPQGMVITTRALGARAARTITAILAAVACVYASVWLVESMRAPTSPEQPRRADYRVSAATSRGVPLFVLPKGKKITVSVTGAIDYGKGYDVGPEGDSGKRHRQARRPDVRLGALLLKYGSRKPSPLSRLPSRTDNTYVVTGRGPRVVRALINDVRGHYKNNTGHFELTVLSKTLVVPSRSWNDTGVDIDVGDKVAIRAWGRVNSSARHKSRTYGWVSPAGWRKPPASSASHTLLLPRGAAFMSLVGRIGSGGQLFRVGKRLKFKSTEQGRLFLTVNDYSDTGPRSLKGNVGSFFVRVSVNNRRVL